MDRTKVESKFLESVGYHAGDKILEVRLQVGDRHVYQYSGVSSELYFEMMQSKSIGSFFLKQIKPHFPCKRMDGRDSDGTRQEEDDQTRPEGGWPDKEDAPE